LREVLLHEACGFRCGIVTPVSVSANTMADLDGFYNAVVITDADSRGESANGGIGRTPDEAKSAAIGEALERYAAGAATFPLRQRRDLHGKDALFSRDFSLFSSEQHATRDFPWPSPADEAETLAPVFSLADNRETWIPQELVGLGSRVEPARLPSTSTGLAAHVTPFLALLRAMDELLERDALTVTWLNGLPGRELDLPADYAEPVLRLGGEVRAFDFTQVWNPHPVVAICGHLPLRGWPRQSFGIACRPTLGEALESAYREWFQGVLFVGYHRSEDPRQRLQRASEVRDFIQHGVYYAGQPRDWAKVPLLRSTPGKRKVTMAAPAASDASASVADLQRALAGQGIRVFYRDLTPADVARLGVTVVRVVSPELSLLHADERTPFLGGRVRDVAWRYPGLAPVSPVFPNPFPHPLG
jgi:ribosomal protein S12 methylthiotransferase accessory factor